MIVLAFCQGDRRTLKDLLSAEVYRKLRRRDPEREQRGERLETQVRRDRQGRDRRRRRCAAASRSLTVRFVSQMISVTRDKAGAIVDGNPETITDVTDVWTFSRDMASRDPNWRLVGTEARAMNASPCLHGRVLRSPVLLGPRSCASRCWRIRRPAALAKRGDAADAA